jgi:hypothetical protein
VAELVQPISLGNAEYPGIRSPGEQHSRIKTLIFSFRRFIFIITTLSKQVIHPAHGLFLHAWQHVGVDAQRHADLAVPQNLLDHLDIDPHCQQDRGRAVSQVMKVHVWQACICQHFMEHRIKAEGVQEVTIHVRIPGRALAMPGWP